RIKSATQMGKLSFGSVFQEVGTFGSSGCFANTRPESGRPTSRESEMSNTARDLFVVGLRNAHAMEVQARELMERQSERLDEYPEVQAKVKEHLSETNQQLKRLE